MAIARPMISKGKDNGRKNLPVLKPNILTPI